jgi:hypothetical protein
MKYSFNLRQVAFETCFFMAFPINKPQVLRKFRGGSAPKIKASETSHKKDNHHRCDKQVIHEVSIGNRWNLLEKKNSRKLGAHFDIFYIMCTISISKIHAAFPHRRISIVIVRYPINSAHKVFEDLTRLIFLKN